MNSISVIIPFTKATRGAAAELARELAGSAQVLLTGAGDPPIGSLPGVQVLRGQIGKGRAIRAALPKATGALTVLQDPDLSHSPQSYPTLLEPLSRNEADAVFARRPDVSLLDRALSKITHLATEALLADPLSGQRAFRTEALQSLNLVSTGEDIDAELVVKLAAQLYRFAEVQVDSPFRPKLGARLSNARTLFRYAALQNDADNQHEGYNTLSRIEAGAPHYNAWLGRRLRQECGLRVLEVGAGIGTITSQLEQGRELLVALELEQFYVERLRNRFRDKPHVRPMLSDVTLTDRELLRAERFDTVVLSNVLEHISDDAASVRTFAEILAPGGRFLVLVPALPELYGSMDEAVGHHRRYTAASLREVLEKNGFTVEKLEWLNLLGIPGWFVNGRLLRRRAVPPLQLRLFDQIAPLLGRLEDTVELPLGMSLLAVGRVNK